MKPFTLPLLGLLWLPLTSSYCPPTGPVLPPPKVPSDGNLTDSLAESLRDLVQSSKAWNASTNSFSVKVTSKEETLVSFHHTADNLNKTGVGKVTSSSIYRVASVTKIFTVLALLLQENLNLDDPASKYVPELAKIDHYKDITLRMLASQLGGVPREGGCAFDLATGLESKVLRALGFPEAPPAPGTPVCDTADTGLCTRSEFFESLKNNNLTWQPGQKAAYSNSGFIILGFVLEKVTSMKFKDIIYEKISKPLGLSSATGFELQDPSRAVLPPDGGFELMSLPLGNYDPTAGLYITPEDLAKFVRSILRHDLLPAPLTDLWLKPTSFLSTAQGAVGMPWEVYRVSDLTPSPRPVDVYTKAGDGVLYAAYIVIIPEYDVGITINVAGLDSYAAGRDLLDLMVQEVVRYFENLAREQARNKYTGKYVNDKDSLVLTVDQGPGIKITEWTSQGKPVLKAWAAISGGNDPNVDARIYPVGENERWRVVFEAVTSQRSMTGIYKDYCANWFSVDQFRYQGLPVDEIDFVTEDGVIKGLKVPGLRQELSKSS
ncbi:beta-lactamase family protein [Fusarium solani]|uniref:Beta-lactamase family protein n=1 Tax=Fusarium solani TaxID=169388 RepID=A0A9P9HP59_FUSSL|nr:beta-lactamase family protein [Fusarium solani]KAH7260019.1 beta-lactamase family protein [Fusarium solani]